MAAKRELNIVDVANDEKAGNTVCADCNEAHPKWSSTNLGIFICIHCSGVHRKIGTHISKVLSVELDTWTSAQVAHTASLGNNKVNESLKFKVESINKPTKASSPNEREHYIRSKYDTDYKGVANKSTSLVSSSNIGMIEFMGMLMIKLISGTNLIAQDINGKSDPYCVFTINKQTVRSKTIEKTLNPVWNEILMLSVPSLQDKLYIKVIDYDAITDDDPMGDCEISLNDLQDGKPKLITQKLKNCAHGVITLELTFNSLDH